MLKVDLDLVEGKVAVLTLDDPQRRNAITPALAAEICATFDDLEGSGRVAVVVVTGRSPAFCAGADLGDLAKADEVLLRSVYAAFLRVQRSPLLTIAAVNGPAVGAGCNLALSCDLRMAGRSARFDTRFLKLGIHSGGGASWLLERAVGQSAATAMLLFGEVVDGLRSEKIGLAWQCVEDDALLESTLALATGAARVPRELALLTKDTIAQVGTLTTHADAVEFELERQLWSLNQPWCLNKLKSLPPSV